MLLSIFSVWRMNVSVFIFNKICVVNYPFRNVQCLGTPGHPVSLILDKRENWIMFKSLFLSTKFYTIFIEIRWTSNALIIYTTSGKMKQGSNLKLALQYNRVVVVGIIQIMSSWLANHNQRSTRMYPKSCYRYSAMDHMQWHKNCVRWLIRIKFKCITH